MTLIRWSPFFEPFDEMDKFITNFPGNRQSGFAPSLDIYQDEKNLIVEAPLVGVKPEDVNITVENDILTMDGKIEKKTEIDDKSYYRKEVRTGSFHRSVALPVSVSGDKAKAEYEDGILKISIPKQEKLKPKSVKVEIKKKNKK